MSHLFVPEHFVIPEKCETDTFRIRTITMDDAVIDRLAVISSVDIIKQTRGEKSCHATWPSVDLTLAENQKDMEFFEQKRAERSLFAYTVVTPDETTCLGCVYVYPCERYLPEKAALGFEVDFSVWVTQAAYDAGLYPSVFLTSLRWLESAWPFKRIFVRNAEIPDEVTSYLSEHQDLFGV